MNPLRTVGGRLALALLVVVGGSLAIVYVIVVPFYESSLVDGRLKDLRHTLALVVPRTSRALFPSGAWMEDQVDPIAIATGTRVAVFTALPRPGAAPLLEPVADSNGGTSNDIVRDVMALRASQTTHVVSGSVTRDGSTYAEAALTLQGGTVLWVATTLHNDLESVEVIRYRVILAASIATAFAIVLGYALATLFAQRIRRLEIAAERIADGLFDEPVVDEAPDEVGQLARAFDRMRLQLASLERARGEFIANASHELRTPLFSLAGFLELLAADEEVDDETRDEFLEVMRGQVGRLTKLATDLLDLSRMDAGGLSVDDEGFDLGAVAELLATEFGPRIASAGDTLALDLRTPAYARGDENRVLQIGRILVENAVVHTAPGTSIGLAVAVEGGRATLTVSDDGPGIPAEARQAVFERFYRLGGTVASGSGLGLAIARELAALMGGRIELESCDGSTTFTLVLASDASTRAGIAAVARKG